MEKSFFLCLGEFPFFLLSLGQFSVFYPLCLQCCETPPRVPLIWNLFSRITPLGHFITITFLIYADKFTFTVFFWLHILSLPKTAAASTFLPSNSTRFLVQCYHISFIFRTLIFICLFFSSVWTVAGWLTSTSDPTSLTLPRAPGAAQQSCHFSDHHSALCCSPFPIWTLHTCLNISSYLLTLSIGPSLAQIPPWLFITCEDWLLPSSQAGPCCLLKLHFLLLFVPGPSGCTTFFRHSYLYAFGVPTV